MKTRMPEINTGSTADIAFLLLTFFLVTTTFDQEKGIMRKLPEWEQLPTNIDVRKRNILPVLINSKDQVMIREKLVSFNEIRKITREFLLNPENRSDLPETELKEIGTLGKIPVTKGVISIQNQRETSYETYIHVLNELEGAGRAVKDEFSREQFGKPFEILDIPRQEMVRKARPCMISEADPVEIR
jgi:biopolymer transport protein ExbD